MSYLAFATCFLAGVAATVYLVHDGHPVFALLCLLLTSGLSLKHKESP